MASINYTYYDSNTDDIYRDGIEEKLIDYNNNNEFIDEYNHELYFYTTNVRENIINWYPFKKNCTILEVGAGVGTVTGALLKNADRVVSVEGSKNRCEALYARHKRAENLEIYCGNFKNIKLDEKFDYIVLIGVFEYAKIFYSTENSFYDFLSDLSKLLKPDGKILIAIENRLGIKYFSGLSEDHLKKPFEGLKGYDGRDVQTFSKSEFTKIVNSCGLKCKYYNVFADYKLPSLIYSDDYEITDYNLTDYQSINYYGDSSVFSEQKTLEALNHEKISGTFCNSYIAEIGKGDFSNIKYVKFQNDRADKYQVITILGDNKVYKKSVSSIADDHLKNLSFIHSELKKNKIDSCGIKKVDDSLYEVEFVKGKTLLSEIADYVEHDDKDSIEKVIDNFVDYLYKESKLEKSTNLLHKSLKAFGNEIRVLPYALFDLHLDNIIDNNGKFILIDQEWWSDKQLPIEYNVFVAINVLFFKVPGVSRLFKIEYFYKKYNLSKRMIDAIIETNKYFFFEDKKFINNYFSKFVREKNLLPDGSDVSNLNVTELIKKIDFKDSLLDFYKTEASSLEAENMALQSELNDVRNQLQCMHGMLGKFNHKIIALISKIRRIGSRIFPRDSKRRKLLQLSLKITKKGLKGFRLILKFIGWIILKLIPFKSIKRKILFKIHNSHKLSSFFGVLYYGNLPRRTCIVDGEERKLNNISYENKKIAVHLHLFYTDLSSEFKKYLSKIPYKFDLYISVPRGVNKFLIKCKFKGIINVNKVCVKTSENCGRDYGPMFVLFSKSLKKYDYLLHIHSKKSLRTGIEQSEWRHYLLDNTLGTRELIMQYFDLLEHHNVGIAYPDTYPGCTYIAHTYLGVSGLAREFYKRLGLNYEDTYLNFSAGSMYWCNVDLIKDIFDLNLTWDDFGVEHGQDDGSLEYVMERIYDPLLKKKNMSYATLNIYDDCFYINKSQKNLINYYQYNKKTVLDVLMNFDTISFDLFDTLVTRKIYNPDDVFILTDKIVADKYNIKVGKFIKERKDAEFTVRCNKNFIGDCSIDEIYDELSTRLSVTKKQIQEIKNIEIDNDLKYIIPRDDMLELYNTLLKKKKKIMIISDMYYTSDILERILNQCGYNKCDKIIVSSEIGLRKSDGTLWNYCYEHYKEFIHVGDNEESDVHQLMIRNKPFLHVMQGKKLFEVSDIAHSVKSNYSDENNIMLGLILNKCLFNSPFALSDEKNNVLISSLFDYGYSVLGPIFLYFFNWLIKNTDHDENLLFISREGYYLQKIYKHIIDKSTKYSEHKNFYFLTSRRAVTVVNINELEDVKKIFETYYDGNLKELFYYRLGIMLPEYYQNKRIKLPYQIDEAMEIARNVFDEIRTNATNERRNYLKYINDSIDTNNKLMLVDLGYSGSVQYELSKLLNQKISGTYFVVSDNVKPLSIGCKVYSCFNKVKDNLGLDDVSIGKYALFLEAFLTSPCGQLVKFNDNGSPIYLSEYHKKELILKLDQIYDGIIAFIDDMVELNIIDICDYNLDKDFVLDNFKYIVENYRMSDEIISTLDVEDFYCSNNKINKYKMNRQ